MGSGKCLGKDTPILMYDGNIKMVQDVMVGDLLMGPDSQPRTVVSLARGQEMMYRVQPVKGDPYVVNESHILSLKLIARDGSREDTINISVRDYLQKHETFKRNVKGWRVGVDFKRKLIDRRRVPPYFMGLWLGDGDSKGASITTMDPEIVDYLYALAKDNHLKIRDYKHIDRCPVYNITSGEITGVGVSKNVIWAKMDAMGLKNNKHIPNEYLLSDREDRLELFAGLIDSDGHIYRGGCDIIFKNERLANQTVFLARSLGFAAYLKSAQKTCTNNGKTGTYFRISISGDFSIVPTKIARKKAEPRQQKKNVLRTGLVLEPIGIDNYYGFELSGPDRLFLLGDFTVTHNTVIFSHLAIRSLQKGKNVMIVCNRQKLVRQSAKTLKAEGVNPYILMQNKVVGKPQLIVASADTLRHRNWPDHIDIVIIDECHLANFTQVLDECLNRGIYVLGVSATPIPNKSNRLDHYYQKMITTKSTAQHILDGELVFDVYVKAKYTPDTKGLKTHKTAYGNDYSSKDVFSLFNKPKVYDDMIKNYLTYTPYKKAVCFCASVEHSKLTAENFRAHGISAAHIDGSDPEEVREKIQKDFEDGKYHVLCNCAIYTFGWDCPAVEVVIVNRATSSYELWRQMIGRGARPFGDKTHFVVIDQGGNFDRHGSLVSEIEWSLTPPSKKKKSDKVKPAPMKHCKHCDAIIPASSTLCPVCNKAQPQKEKELAKAEFELVTPEIAPKKEWPSRKDSKDDIEFVKKCIEFGAAMKYHQNAALHRVLASFEPNEKGLALRIFAQVKSYKPGWVAQQQKLSNRYA